MVQQSEATGLDGFSVSGSVLLRDVKEIARFQTPIRELLRFRHRLFVALDPRCAPPNHSYAGTNLLAVDLEGREQWRAPNLNRSGSSNHHYFELRLIDAEQPRIFARTDERSWCYLDPVTGEIVKLDPDYDWSNYEKAWKQFIAFHKAIDKLVFASSLKFPSPS